MGQSKDRKRNDGLSSEARHKELLIKVKSKNHAIAKEMSGSGAKGRYRVVTDPEYEYTPRDPILKLEAQK